MNEPRLTKEHAQLVRVASYALDDPDGNDGELNLREFFRRLDRHKGVLLSTILLITSITILVVSQLTPRYTSTTKLIIDTRQAKVIDIEQVLGGLDGDSAVVQNEIQVLTSRELAGRAVDKLNLVNEPEFNARLRPPTFTSELNPVRLLPEAWKKALLGAQPPQEIAERDRQQRIRSAVVSAFLRAVEVRPEGRSRVLTISATSEKPELAQRMAGTLADLYLVDQLEAKFEATRRATAWLNERVQDLRAQVEASERAVEAYRKQAGLTKAKDTTLTAQQVAEINTQLILARTQRAEASARLRQVERLLTSPDGVGSAAEVLASPLIQRLKEQEAEVERRAAEMATEYGPKHPKMINIRADIQDLKARIQSEVDKVVAGLRNELRVAQARERTLGQDLDKLKSDVGELDTAEVELRALEREAAANQALFKTFLERLKETGEQDDLQQPDARIISKANLPGGPSYPNAKRLITIGFVFSVVAGVLIILLIEYLDPGFRSSEQIEQMLGIRTLALSPLMTGLKRLRMRPEQYVVERPRSSFAESLRTLHTGLLLSDVDDPPKVVLFTSGLPREGKTTLAVSMARLVAQAGKKVVLVDADIRKGQATARLKLDRQPGLVDLLSTKGNVAASKIIQRDDQTPLHFLSAGSNAPSPPDLFGSNKMRGLLKALRNEYDLVVIDSPPILVVSDALALAHLVDKTVFLIEWARTRRGSASMGVKTLRDSDADVAGVVLTKVNARKHAQYNYGDSGYYYGPVRRYYAD